MMRIWTDGVFALRSLARNRLYAISAIATLALGVAAATVVFAVVHGVLLNPLRYDDPAGIVVITPRSPASGTLLTFSVAEYEDVRRALVPRVFARTALYRRVEGNLTGAERPDRITSQGVTGEFFSLLGVAPEVGRVFRASEERPGVADVTVISHALWQRRFGGARDVIGRHLRLDDDEYTIAGVMPPEFEHPGATRATAVDLWFLAGFRRTPFRAPSYAVREAGNTVIARLAPGVTAAAAGGEVARLMARVAAEHPGEYDGSPAPRFEVTSLRDSLVPKATQRGLIALLAAVVLVLLISCANVAGLQLMRGMARHGELAVRRALGASRGRLVVQLLTESAVLSVIAGVVGASLANITTALIRSRLPATLPLASATRVDGVVLLTSMAVALLLALLFGLVPALTSTQVAISVAVRVAGTGGNAASSRARAVLVVGEVALAAVLLTGGALLLRSFLELQRVRPGFDRERLLTFQMSVPFPNNPSLGKYVAGESRAPYYAEVLRRLREIPGVEAVGAAGLVPFSGSARAGVPVVVDGDDATTDLSGRLVELNVASPGYLSAMRIPLMGGRDFLPSDTARSAPVALVSQRLARLLWPGQNPVGKRLKRGRFDSSSPWVTVVGVVGDVHTHSLDGPPDPQLYVPLAQLAPFTIGVVARTRGDPRTYASRMAATVREVENDQPVYAVQSMDELLETELAQRRHAAFAVGGFALLALVLAGVGLYALVAFTVSSRARELGIRLALGMTPSELVTMVLRHGLSLALVGLVLGVSTAAVLASRLTSVLYGVSAHDPLVFVLVSLLLTLAVAAAAWLPARRAAAVDPLTVLRS